MSSVDIKGRLMSKKDGREKMILKASVENKCQRLMSKIAIKD